MFTPTAALAVHNATETQGMLHCEFEARLTFLNWKKKIALLRLLSLALMLSPPTR